MSTLTQFRWSTLTVSLVGSISASQLTPTAALDRATESLKRWQVKVSRDQDHGVLRFTPTFMSGRSWLSAVMKPQVSAAIENESTVVVVSASLAPLVIMSVAFSAVASAINPILAILLGLWLIGGNYAFIDYGMRRVLTETLTARSAQSPTQPTVPR